VCSRLYSLSTTECWQCVDASPDAANMFLSM
jgi:hypothetical protein